MAQFDYPSAAATAQRLLSYFGQAVTLTRVTAGEYDPVTGETTGGGEESQTGFAVLLDYTLQESGATFSDGGQIRVGDKKCLIEAKGLAWVPDALTKLVDASGQTWQLEAVRELSPAGVVPVMYTANATR